MDVSKFDFLGQTINIKDIVSRTLSEKNVASGSAIANKLYSGAKCYIIGDSIGAGYGWWNAKGESQNDTNDGFFPYFRKKYPNSEFVNRCVNGATIATGFGSYPNIFSQIDFNDADIVFICCGINDFTYVFLDTATPDKLGQLPDLLNTSWAVSDKTYNAIGSLVSSVKTRNPNATVYMIIPSTAHTDDYYLWYAHFDNIKRVCEFLGVPVFDCDNHIPRYQIPEAAPLYTDRVHYSEKGYGVLSPAIDEFIMHDGNENSLKTDMVFTNKKGSAAEICTGFFSMYKEWWFDGCYRVVYAGNAAIGSNPIMVSQNAGFATGVYVNGVDQRPYRFFYDKNTELCTVFEMLASYTAVKGQKLSDLCSVGVYFIPSELCESFEGLPSALKRSDKGFVIVEVLNGGDYATGFMYPVFSESDGNLFRFTRMTGDSFAYWKITETSVS